MSMGTVTVYSHSPTILYYADQSGVREVLRTDPDRWPTHVCDRVLTKAEHGEDIYVCRWWPTHDFIGNLAKAVDHLNADQVAP